MKKIILVSALVGALSSPVLASQEMPVEANTSHHPEASHSSQEMGTHEGSNVKDQSVAHSGAKEHKAEKPSAGDAKKAKEEEKRQKFLKESEEKVTKLHEKIAGETDTSKKAKAQAYVEKAELALKQLKNSELKDQVKSNKAIFYSNINLADRTLKMSSHEKKPSKYSASTAHGQESMPHHEGAAKSGLESAPSVDSPMATTETPAS